MENSANRSAPARGPAPGQVNLGLPKCIQFTLELPSTKSFNTTLSGIKTNNVSR